MRPSILLAPACAALILASASSCIRRPIDYEYTDKAAVTVILDWSKAGIDPNGATVLLYPADGSKFLQVLTQTDTAVVNLAVGGYTILAFNETFSDMDNILFRGEDEVSALEAYLTEEGIRASGGETVFGNPEILASAVKADFQVTLDMVRKTRAQAKATKEGTRSFDPDLTVRIAPERLVHEVTVTAYVKGLGGVSSAGAYIHGFAESVFLAEGRYSENGVTQKVAFTERKFNEGSEVYGYLRGEFNCFGPKGGFEAAVKGYSVTFRAALGDGTFFEQSFGLDERNITYGKGDYALDVKIVIASPEDPIVIPTISGDGGWKVDVDEWDDRTVPIEFK